jgi:hypothetical protein
VVPNPTTTGQAMRGCPDSSANADPATGYQIVTGGQWVVVGGTSASSPLTAGYVAACLSSSAGSVGDLAHLLYAARGTAFSDITTGSDGFPAVSGWDPATGLGSPNGPGLLAALTNGSIQPTLPGGGGGGGPPIQTTIKDILDKILDSAIAKATNPWAKFILMFAKHLIDQFLAQNPTAGQQTVILSGFMHTNLFQRGVIAPIIQKIVDAWLDQQIATTQSQVLKWVLPVVKAAVDSLLSTATW